MFAVLKWWLKQQRETSVSFVITITVYAFLSCYRVINSEVMRDPQVFLPCLLKVWYITSH